MDKPTHHDYIILGAGPAGLQMGYFMQKDNQDYLILDGSDRPGSFFTTQPRHRTLISINKVHNPFPEKEFNMRHDWNSLLSDDDSLRFTKYTEELFPNADFLLQYLEDFARKSELKIVHNTFIENIDKCKNTESGEDEFKLRSKTGKEYTCRVLLLATGAREELLPDIPGIELADTYNGHSIDQNEYKGKNVAIIGRGNSAFEVANHLAGHAAVVILFGGAPLKLAWDTHFVGDLRAVNNTILDMYQLKSLHSYTGLEATALEKQENGKIRVELSAPCLHWSTPGYFKASNPVDKVICCTGFKYVDLSIFSDSCKPATRVNGKYPKLKLNWEVENVSNMYYIGTAMQTLDRQAASGFIHGFRYNIKTLYHMLNERYQNVPYPTVEIERDAKKLGTYIIERLGICASLYQMQGFLCDVIVVSEDADKKVIYYEDLPFEHVLKNESFMKEKHLFIALLKFTFDNRFGNHAKGALKWNIFPAYENPSCQAFLRPNLLYYREGEFVGEQWAHESLVLRFDVQNLQNTNPMMNHHLFSNFINKHTNISPGEHYNDYFLDDEDGMEKYFTPLTKEEMERLPPEFYDDVKCKGHFMHLEPKM
ncbi:FAD-dependent oxidoreductase domain-containing protein 2-like [Glandiceps talaboti]